MFDSHLPISVCRFGLMFVVLAAGIPGQDTRPTTPSVPFHFNPPRESSLHFEIEWLRSSILEAGRTLIEVSSRQTYEFEIVYLSPREDRGAELALRFRRAFGGYKSPNSQYTYDTARSPEQDVRRVSELARMRLLIQTPTAAMFNGEGRLMRVTPPEGFITPDLHEPETILTILRQVFDGVRAKTLKVGDMWTTARETEFAHQHLDHVIENSVGQVDEGVFVIESRGKCVLHDGHNHAESDGHDEHGGENPREKPESGEVKPLNQGAEVLESKVSGRTEINRGDGLPRQSHRSTSWTIRIPDTNSKGERIWHVSESWKLTRVDAPTTKPAVR